MYEDKVAKVTAFFDDGCKIVKLKTQAVRNVAACGGAKLVN